jgi:hypothetical protein
MTILLQRLRATSRQGLEWREIDLKKETKRFPPNQHPSLWSGSLNTWQGGQGDVSVDLKKYEEFQQHNSFWGISLVIRSQPCHRTTKKTSFITHTVKISATARY